MKTNLTSIFKKKQHCSPGYRFLRVAFLFHLLLVLQLGFTTPVFASVIYVDATAGGSNNGASWANAYTSLQSALNKAASGDEIWVAKGTYHPSSAYDLTNTSRYYHFEMIEGVAIYGGFAGTETSVDERSDFGAGGVNETILSGDLNGDDVVSGSGSTLSITGNSENCYNVFYHSSALTLTSAAILNGFTITGGNANDYGISTYGGGMYNNSSSPKLINVTFSGNYAFLGGGMHDDYASSVLINVAFSGNSAGFGAGMYTNYSSSMLTNVTFSDNSSSNQGGGMEITNSSPSLTNVLFSGNFAASKGGGVYNHDSSPTLTNVTISGNSSVDGGGVFNFHASPMLNNTILWGNTASGNGNQIAMYLGVEGITTLNYSCYGNGTNDIYVDDGTIIADNNNITDDPEFIDAGNGDYHIYGISPCAGSGDNSYNSENTDIRGEARIQNSIIDMGAYEWTAGVDLSGGLVYYVDVDAIGNNDGSNWFDAYTSLQSALDVAASGDEIWVAKGTYHPSSAYHWANTSRNYHFEMIEGVAIYGGFAGTETSVDERSDFGVGGTNETILSGDLNEDDVVSGSGASLTIDNNGENCYHVFYNNPASSVLSNASILNGFTITGGNDDDPGSSIGGGMCNYSSSPMLTNVTFSGNSSGGYGGGMYNNSSSSPVLTNVTFSGNFSGDFGGGMVSSSSLVLTNVMFIGNFSLNGGGMVSFSSSPVLANVTFSDNFADEKGGGMYNTTSSPILTNIVFSGNSSSIGGGMYNSSSSPMLTNVTFSGNFSLNGGGMFNQASFPTLNNTILWGNTASGNGNQIFIYTGGTTTLNYSCYENDTNDIYVESGTITTDNNNITDDPEFIDENNGDYRIFVNSPCVDSGDNSYNLESTDIRGEARIQNSTIDMGAYEWTEGLDGDFPTIETEPITIYDATSATMGGSISDDGGMTVTERGVVFSSENTNPEIGGDDVTRNLNGDGKGTFSKSINSLTSGTTYYVQAYAINSVGTSYGGVESFTTYSLPEAQCKNISIELDAYGSAIIDSSDLDNGSTAEAGIKAMGLSKSSFSCADIGANNVTLTVTDEIDNTDQCVSVVTVSDQLAPVFTPIGNVSVQLPAGECEGTIDYPKINVHDNCSSVTLKLLLGLGADGVFPVGTTTEIWQATDGSGNKSVISFDVTVTPDNAAPTIDAVSDVTLSGYVSSVVVPLSGISGGNDCTPQDVDVNASADNSDLISSVSVNYEEGTTGSVELFFVSETDGVSEVTVTVEDSEGAVTTENFQVTVDGSNDSPFVVGTISNQVVNASYELKISVSSELGVLFNDSDDSILELEVIEEGKDTLPSWAVYENDTLYCTPSINDVGCVNMVVTATDREGLTASDTFQVCVEGYPSSAGDINTERLNVELYPNPTKGKAVLHINSLDVNYIELSVMDISGSMILKEQYSGEQTIHLDISGKASGMYFIHLNLDGVLVTKKLVLDKR